MRLRINDLTAALDDDSTLEDLAARRLKIPRGAIGSIRLIRKTIDARRRHGAPILFNYIIEVDLDDGVRPKGGAAVASDNRPVRTAVVRAAAPTRRSVVIGF